jgi:GntR family transcriptional regulator
VLPLPYHAQVREALRARILDGTYLPEQQMPSEHEMTALFGVSRITVRQALNDLQNEGLIYRLHGKGTYVSRPRATQDLAKLQSFGEAMRPLGYETHSRLVSVRSVKPPAAVGERLGTPRASKVCEIKRVRFLNREPVSLDVSYFELALGQRLAAEDLQARDIFVILEHDFAIALGHADLVIGARLADDVQARLLDTTVGAGLLFIDRVTRSRDGAPIACEHLFHRGDAYHFHVRVERQPAGTPP